MNVVWRDQIEASEDTGTIMQVRKIKPQESYWEAGKKQTWVVLGISVSDGFGACDSGGGKGEVSVK